MKRKKTKQVISGEGSSEYGDLADVMSPTGGLELMRFKDPMDLINQPMSSVATALLRLLRKGKKK
jgi:hypothetical protein